MINNLKLPTMSTPIEQMILDAKRLANRLKEKENLADVIMNEAVNCVRGKILLLQKNPN